MYFPTKYLRPYRKITPKPHFGGPFNANPIIQIGLRKSHVNESYEGETLQLYRYRQVLEVSIFFHTGAGPINVNLGPPILSRKLLELES